MNSKEQTFDGWFNIHTKMCNVHNQMEKNTLGCHNFNKLKSLFKVLFQVENWLTIRNFSGKYEIQMPFLEVVWLTCMQNVVVEKSLIELGDVQQQIEQWSNILSSFPRLETQLPLMLALPYLLQQALHGMISTYLELHTRGNMPLGNQFAFTIALMQCQ